MPKSPKRTVLVSVSAVVLVVAAGSLLLYWSGRGPRKPGSIPQSDYTYVRALAAHRLQRLMKQYHLPGAAVALIDDQETVFQAAYGLANVEEELPATTDTVYKVWSVAKLFTALETMRLVEEGLVDLDAPITDYLPDLAIQSRFPDSEPATIRQLLTHRAGLPRNGCHWAAGRPLDDVLNQLVDSLADCHLAYPAGYRYKYSNIGIDTLGRLIEELRGDIFARYMQEHLLAPMGMDSSAFFTGALPAAAERALGYEYYEGDYYPYQQGDIDNLPSGNLYASLDDMATFAKFIFRDGAAGDRQIIGPETLALAFTEQPNSPQDPQRMGLGWKISTIGEGELMVWHDGGPTEGIGALVALLPQRKLGIVLMANEISFEGNLSAPLAVEILERMLETRDGIVPQVEEEPESAAVAGEVLAGYAGKYIAMGEIMTVSADGDRLQGEILGQRFNLRPISDDTFRLDHWLLGLGLEGLFKLPPGLDELELAFDVGDDPAAGEAHMIVNLAGFAYETAPRYPDLDGLPAAWQTFVGQYDCFGRLPSGRPGSEPIGRAEIWFEDGVLHMSGVIGPIRPLDATTIIILGGSYAGETITCDPATGYLTHQMHVYKPAEG